MPALRNRCEAESERGEDGPAEDLLPAWRSGRSDGEMAKELAVRPEATRPGRHSRRNFLHRPDASREQIEEDLREHFLEARGEVRVDERGRAALVRLHIGDGIY